VLIFNGMQDRRRGHHKVAVDSVDNTQHVAAIISCCVFASLSLSTQRLVSRWRTTWQRIRNQWTGEK